MRATGAKSLMICAALACSVDRRAVGTLPSASRPASEVTATGGTSGDTPRADAEDDMLILTVYARGDGVGIVRLSTPSVEPFVCGTRCSVFVPPGGSATVTAAAGQYSVIQGWSDPACSGLSCVVRVDSDTDLSVEFQLVHNVAFVSSQSYLPTELPRPGAAAGAECARLAAAAGVHGTHWVAWLSAGGPTEALEDDVNARDFFQHTGGWLRTDGEPVARSLDALTTGQLLHPINLTESRGFPPWGQTWAGTGLDGNTDRSPSVADCRNWSSNAAADSGSVGIEDGVGAFWAGFASAPCDVAQPITCLGDDSDAELVIVPAQGRLAFLSVALFTPGGGVAAADTLCQREACEAGLTGSSNCAQNLGAERSFSSYLHLQTRRAWERFNLTGSTWVRPDGVQWLANAGDLMFDAADQLAALNVTLDLQYMGEPRSVWIGDTSGLATCADWASPAGLGNATVYDGVSNAPLSTGASSECSSAARLYCLEE